jgi:hypothetical protein
MAYRSSMNGRALKAQIDKAVRALDVQKRAKLEPAIVGDNNFNIHPVIGGKLNTRLYLVRPDTDSPAEALPWSGLGVFKPQAGEDVLVGYHNGVRCIYSVDTITKIEKGINPNVLNTGDTRLHGYMDTEGFPRLQCRAIGTASKPSTVILVNELLTFTDEHEAVSFRGAQFDVAPYIPDADLHCLVHLWFNPATASITATSSTPKNIVIDIEAADYEECLSTKPARALPTGVYKLANAQTSVSEYDKWYDGRQFFRHEPPRMQWSSTTPPTASADETAGYGVGSLWVYQGVRYFCSNAAEDAAKWYADCFPLTISGDYTVPAGHIQMGSIETLITGELTIEGELLLI